MQVMKFYLFLVFFYVFILQYFSFRFQNLLRTEVSSTVGFHCITIKYLHSDISSHPHTMDVKEVLLMQGRWEEGTLYYSTSHHHILNLSYTKLIISQQMHCVTTLLGRETTEIPCLLQ